MTPHAHGGVLVVLVAVVLGALGGNALVSLAVGLAPRAGWAQLPALERSRAALVGLALPLLMAGLAVAAVLSVPALALVAPGLDHCTSHAGAPHVCFVHGTFAFGSAWEAAGVVVLGALLVVAVGGELLRFARSRRALSSLLAGAPRGDVVCTEDDAPYAFTVGVLRPRVVVSAGLSRALSARQLEAALFHERSHVEHGDALWRLVARVSSFLLVAPLRRALTFHLVLGQEQRADADAAARTGSASLVAETLLALVRAGPPASVDPLAPSLAGWSLEARVAALCGPPARGRVAAKLWGGVALLAVVLLAARAPLHDGAEAAAGLLLESPVHAHHDDGRVFHPHR